MKTTEQRRTCTGADTTNDNARVIGQARARVQSVGHKARESGQRAGRPRSRPGVEAGCKSNEGRGEEGGRLRRQEHVGVWCLVRNKWGEWGLV